MIKELKELKTNVIEEIRGWCAVKIPSVTDKGVT
jgi:hypothetical protein